MTRADRIAADANERVSTWDKLSPAEREDLLANNQLTSFDSGGALLTVNGVDRFFASRPDALDELAARSKP